MTAMRLGRPGGLALFALLSGSVFATGAAHAQLLSDGDFDALAVGTAPDCAAPAGAWEWPAAYVTAGLCETLPEEYQIVETSSFDPGATGNSLSLSSTDPAGNFHLTNLLTSAVNEPARATLTFDIFVPTAGSGGGSIYIGGDHGGGGFSNLTDRGPQLTFQADGRLTARDGSTNTDVVLVQQYLVGEWATVELVIDMVSDTFDTSYGPRGAAVPVAAGSPYRSPSGLTFIDRVTIAHFGGAFPIEMAHFDNFSVESQGGCYPDCDGNTILDVFDFLCFQDAFVAMTPYADCDGNTVYDVFDFLCFQDAFVTGCP
jgi:hypothetical protein